MRGGAQGAAGEQSMGARPCLGWSGKAPGIRNIPDATLTMMSSIQLSRQGAGWGEVSGNPSPGRERGVLPSSALSQSDTAASASSGGQPTPTLPLDSHHLPRCPDEAREGKHTYVEGTDDQKCSWG